MAKGNNRNDKKDRKTKKQPKPKAPRHKALGLETWFDNFLYKLQTPLAMEGFGVF